MEAKKIREAIEELKKIIYVRKRTLAALPNSVQETSCLNKEIEAVEIAIKALEKQLPKKVEQRRDYRDFNNQHVRYTGFCPNCKMTVTSNRNRTCHKCGQALDWSE